MQDTHKIFFTGATGYIGGSLLDELLKNKNYHITCLVRDQSKCADIQQLGAAVVIGSLDDTALIEQQCAGSDIVLHMAHADHVASCKSIIEGLKKNKKNPPPIFIHTSGTGVLCDKSNGQFASDKVFDDGVLADTHENIAVDAWHRDVDTLVYEAGRTGLIDCYIVCPPLIYGYGTGPGNRESIQIPGLIECAIKHKRAVHAGKGVNIWSNVHIDDLVDFYILLLEKAITRQAPKNDNGYYFAENGSNNFKEVTDEIGKAMLKYGLTSDPTSEDITENVSEILPGVVYPATAHNSRSKATKARALGWKPHRPDLLSTLDETVKRLSKK